MVVCISVGLAYRLMCNISMDTNSCIKDPTRLIRPEATPGTRTTLVCSSTSVGPVHNAQVCYIHRRAPRLVLRIFHSGSLPRRSPPGPSHFIHLGFLPRWPPSPPRSFPFSTSVFYLVDPSPRPFHFPLRFFTPSGVRGSYFLPVL
jgi:hypothetical protein